MRTWVLCLAVVALVGCNTNARRNPPQAVKPTPDAYRRPPQASTPAVPMAPRAPVAKAPSVASSPFRWYDRIADAQMAARAQGKLILVGSTKPGCGLCEKFRTQIVPAASVNLDAVAVGYFYDITRPEDPRVDRVLRANLPNATLMPLVGFLTPDLQWVHGFWGGRDVGQFLSDIAVARRIYPVTVAVLPEAAAGPVEVAVVNEYGETEWSAPGDVWPAAEDAIGPEETLAVATAPAAPTLVPSAPAFPPVGSSAIVATQAPAPIVVAPPPPAAPVEPPAPVAAPPAPSVEAPAAAPVHERAGDEAWAREALRTALAQIREGNFDEARRTLAEVSRAVPQSSLAREADKGTVAIYNARRIQGAQAEERSRLIERARKDLGGSMWGELFSS
jgi:hypothetical protein